MINTSTTYYIEMDENEAWIYSDMGYIKGSIVTEELLEGLVYTKEEILEAAYRSRKWNLPGLPANIIVG